MTQRDKMRELLRIHQGDKAAVISAYARAEEAGEVNRLRNSSGYGTEQYARALWNDGEKKGWLTESRASSSGRKYPAARSTPILSSDSLVPIQQPPAPPPPVQEPPTPAAFVAHLAAVKVNLQTLKTAQDQVENTIAQMERWIGLEVTNQPKLVENYIETVREWLPGWDRLEKASQAFLPQAELLFDGATEGENQDFSPFIIQYCRALENEFLIKLFSAYTDDLRARYQDDLDAFLVDASVDDKTAKFAKMVKNGDKKYTLGEMRFIMSLLKVNGSTFSRVRLLGDFRAFALANFSEEVLTQTYLDQINRITTDFRNRAAHPNLIGKDVAEECRSLIRGCLNVFILNYRGPSSVPDRLSEV